MSIYLKIFISILVVNIIVILSLLIIKQYKNDINGSVVYYYNLMKKDRQDELKGLVDYAYNAINTSYTFTEYDTTFFKEFETDYYSADILKALKINSILFTKENLRNFKFGNDGNFWINEYESPYKIILATSGEHLEGNDWIFYIDNTNKNLFEMFSDTIAKNGGEGFVEYNFYKTGGNERLPRIGYVKLHKELSWVISASYDITSLDEFTSDVFNNYNNKINSIIRKIVFIDLIIVILILFLLFVRTKTNINK